MEFEKVTNIQGVRLLKPIVYEDDRGYFFESFNSLEFNKNMPLRQNIKGDFIQDNHSISKRGVIRGMHLQINPHEQTKLIRVIKGKVLDVIVDLRKDSKTYLQNFSIELSGENKKILLIPTGCLHGFLSLEDDTIFNYKVTDYWNKDSERGIRWDDPDINIDWKLKEYNIENIIVGEKDRALPYLKEYKD